VGDVSGKGIPASLFMAVACNLFRVLSWQGNPPAEVARQINNEMSQHNEQLMFVTLFIGCLDLKTGRLDFCNCGHNPPVLFTPEPHFMTCEPNTPIGIMPGYAFEGQTMEHMRGVRIFLYTDGLNEAENVSHEEFGNERMMNALASLPHSESAQGVVEKVHAAVASHVGIAEASDDLTMLCIKLA
jgi:serine phosphatase RsbU (regulator of sigma subunit)